MTRHIHITTKFSVININVIDIETYIYLFALTFQHQGDPQNKPRYWESVSLASNPSFEKMDEKLTD